MMSGKEGCQSRRPGLGGMERTHLPDYGIGATVLVVAIALPFFIFTRAEHLQRTGSARPPALTPTAQVQGVITTPDPTGTPSPSPAPQAGQSTASPQGRPAAKQVPVHPTSVPTSPTSAPISTPSSVPDSPPVAVLALAISSGPAPLTVTADASGSSDNDPTPIAQVIFNFGDGTIVTAGSDWKVTHTYANPGTYTLAVAVIDTARLSSTGTATVTVN